MDRIEIESQLRDLIDEVVEGHENLMAGQDFGMKSINQRIDATCKAALALPNEDVVLLQPHMAELRDRLLEFSNHLDMIMSRLKEAEEEDAATAAPISSEDNHPSETPPLPKEPD